MDVQTLRDRLITDPAFVFHYIFANNPDQVILNLRALGFLISNEDNVMEAVNELLQNGHQDTLIQAFNVPMLSDQVDPAELAIVGEAAVALNTVGGSASRSIKIDWTTVFGSLVTGAATVIASKNGSVGNNPAPAPPAPKKDNTTTIAIIAGGVLLVVVIIFLVIKHKAKA